MHSTLGAAIPSVSRFRALLESARMARDPVAVLCGHSSRLGATYRYYFGGIKEVLVTSKPAILAHVLKTNWENYRKSDIQMRHMRHFLGEGLLTSHGECWRHKRRPIQAGFRTERLTSALAVMQASLEESLTRFDAAIEQGPVDLSQELMSMTFAMVSRSLFGANIPTCDVELISTAIVNIQKFMVRRITKPFLAPWFHISGAVRRYDAVRRGGDAALFRHIAGEARSGERDENLLDVLLALTDGASDKPLDRNLVLAECMQLLVAGHETSSNVLAWALYLLVRHPAYLDRCKREFAEVLGAGPLTVAHLPALKQVSAILDETMRLYPAFWMVDRVAIADDVADGVAIPAGTTVVAFIYGVHHSPELWAQPEQFQPERFEGDGRDARHRFLHLPFGGGPRQCVASNFANLQMVLIMSVLLQRYEFVLASDHPIVPQPLFILRPRGGVQMYVTRRETN